eukprot:scaffold8921_cov137-Isochrysis_galbana.AAC.7
MPGEPRTLPDANAACSPPTAATMRSSSVSSLHVPHASHPKPHTYATPHTYTNIRIASPTAHTYLMHTILRYVCTCI